MFSNENLRKAQQKKENDTSNSDESISNNKPEMLDTSTEGRSQRAKRDAFRYLSSPQDPLCIMCNVAKFDWKTRKKVPTTMIEIRKEGQTLYEAEKRLVECAKIHDVKDAKHKETATRILLLASARSLFAADVCYHKNCYASFTGWAWHREENVKEADNKSDLPVIEIEKFFDLVENHIIGRGEVYIVSQLGHFYADMFGKSIRSISIKAMLEDRFGDKSVYGKPVEFASNESAFVYSSNTKFTDGVIRSATISIGIQTSIMIRNLATRISHNIKLRLDVPWPPTPNQIIELKDEIDLDLYNFLAILVSSKPSFEKGVADYLHQKQ